MTPRVVYWNNIPAPYMVDRFNAVARRGNLDFEAWFSYRTEEGRSWEISERRWQFPHTYLPTVPPGRANVDPAAGLGARGYSSIAIPLPSLRRRAPDVIVSLYAEPWYLAGWSAAKLRGVRTAFWVETTFDAWVTRRRWKEAMKSILFPRVDAILTPGPDGRRFAIRYGAPHERIMIVPHVIDAAHYSSLSTLEGGERRRLRRELGLKGVTFVYVGRLWEKKGVGHLLEAFAMLQRSQAEEVSLLLVGDGDFETTLRARCTEENLRNVVFVGFHDANALPRFYGMSDVFVFPSFGDTFGLVLSEALACGLPAISSASVGELEVRISDGLNGFVVPPADSHALFERMSQLARNHELRATMGHLSSERVAGESPERWAEAFERAVMRILELPRQSFVHGGRPT